MKKDYLADLLSNPLRARALRALAHSEGQPLTDKELAQRSASTLARVEKELSPLIKSGVITVSGAKHARTWALNAKSAHTAALVQFVHAVAPVRHERIVETLKKAGRLSTVIIAGTFLGDGERSVDLVLALESVNETQVDRAVRALEGEWGREIRYAVFPTAELRYRLTVQDKLLRDVLDFSHKVLLDKGGIIAFS